MMRSGAQRRIRLAVGICLGLATWTCEPSDPGVVPQRRSRSSNSMPMAAARQMTNRPIAGESVTTSSAVVDATVVTNACGSMTIRTSHPRRIRHEVCGEEYLVDLLLEMDRSDTAALEMLRNLDVADWRVHMTGERVRHAVSLVRRPYRHWRRYRPTQFGFTHGDAAGGVTQPWSVRLCPDERPGSVILACSDEACGLYEDEDQIPQVFLPSQEVVVEAPWSYDEIQELREGETLEVPVRYLLRPRSGSTDVHVELIHLVRRSSRVIAITPREQRIVDSGRPGTVTFRIRAQTDGVAQAPIIEHFAATSGGRWDRFPECKVRSNNIRVRIRDR